MEAFESLVALALEDEGLVVSEAVKFPVTLYIPKATHTEVQTHGFEVDLIGARRDRLVLASVKSAFGSHGIVADHVSGDTDNVRAKKLYALLNNQHVRSAVIAGAADRFGYDVQQVQLRLYVGKFAGPKHGLHEQKIRAWCAGQSAGYGPIAVFGVHDVVARVIQAAAKKQYRNNPVLVTMKALEAAGMLNLTLPNGADAGAKDADGSLTTKGATSTN
jgi:hypothetical protein